MKRPIRTKERFFLRRTGIFFLIMMVPTLLLCGFMMYFSVQRTEHEIDQKGRQTLAAVEANCELIISNVFTQNDLFTGTTRMSMALKHSLLGTSTSYNDAIFLSSLNSVLKSVVNTHAYIDSVYIYLDDAPRYFDSYKGITDIATSQDLTWLPLYQTLAADEKEMICIRVGEYGRETMSFVKRMLMQKGCAVVNIAPGKLKGILETLLTREHETITLLDRNGTILVSTDNDADCGMSQEEIDALMDAGGAAYQGWFRPIDEEYYINAVANKDMIIVASVSAKLLTEQALMSMQSFVWVFLLNLLIILLLSYVTTRRSFNQIRHMMSMFEAAESGLPVEKPSAKARDEYDVVMNNIIYMFLKETRLRSKLQEQKLEKEHSELMALQLQINPHFLYNTLQTLEMEIKSCKGSPIDTGELVQRISDILRYALSAPQETVPLREELQYLRKYAAVQQYRFGDRFILYYEAEDDLADTPVFRLMLQPLVENSLIHGMKADGERLYIWVRAEYAANRIRFSVSDTGVGMTEEEVTGLIAKIHDADSRSIGLTNLNRRLLLYYGSESELSITARPGEGMEVSFTIPG